LAPFPSRAVGVGRSITAEGIIRSPDDPRWFGPPFVPSVARGVGNNEQPLPTVWGSHGGSRYAAPPAVVPDVGQVSDHSGESPSKVTSDVLQHDESRSQVAYGVPDGRPDPAVVILSFPESSSAVRLARVAGRDDVHRSDRRPVGGGDVAVVGHAGPVVGEDPTSGEVAVGVPRDLAAEYLERGDVESAVWIA
jgi:hypothetical protein